jgi:hypothetical protein
MSGKHDKPIEEEEEHSHCLRLVIEQEQQRLVGATEHTTLRTIDILSSFCKTYEYVQNEQKPRRKSRSNQSAAKDGSLFQKDKGCRSRGSPIGFAGFAARS